MKKVPRTSRDLQAAERRAQILQGAKELFAKHGYHGTSIRTLNKHIEITDGLLYHYFPGGKQEILETIFQETQAYRVKIMDDLIAGIKPGQPLEEALYLLVSGMVKTMAGDRDFLKIMLHNSESIMSEDKNFFSKMILQRSQALTDALAHRAKDGEIREMDFQAAAKQVVSIGIMAVFSEVTELNLVDNSDVESYLKNMVTFTVSLWRK
ncbi:TetR/AcrR family transcriptional regulator [Paenibacillus psychroresistens]|uniref:TetR/AcrR family transcriptional regulator n=1 Tax=Paenibacillus psychroresistens TaxID=1778678 RepID=A0A6B8RF08_9BACL|nr:TetR/AcrR family transcriptional regulator [Paenibacillus psychroresistens]QGQ95081.1 TetR/AcrR family transcriptional regulator [Paenibacillus psychroresistens]